ncbi:MAG: NeuD/PglB/VioB family sugar acetyltransferase [Ilumatobacteraceae bacterium]
MVAGRRLVIVGAGDHGRSVLETAMAAGFDVEAFVDRTQSGEVFGVPIIASVPDGHVAGGGALCVAIGDNSTREAAVERLGVPVDSAVFPSLVHPSASVSRFATVGAGTVVLQGAVVGSAAAVGAFCIVNTRASLDHDGVLEDFASLAPGVTLGGTVRVGRRSAIGIGAVAKQGVTIGADTVVGANSYLDRDLGDCLVAYGTPARAVRSRRPDDRYLG